MNIDKFGHHVHKRLLQAQNSLNILDNTLHKSESGEFDLRLARLKGVALPISSDDAVNKQYVDITLQKFYTKTEIDAELKNIKNNILALVNQFQPKLQTTTEEKKMNNEQKRNN